MNGANKNRTTQEVEMRKETIDSADHRAADNHSGKAEQRDEFLTKKELATRLKVSVRTVEQWQHDGHIPYLRVAGVLLFHWPAVVKALTEKFTIRRGGCVRPTPTSTPHPDPVASQARHEMDAPHGKCASRTVVPDRGGEGMKAGRGGA